MSCPRSFFDFNSACFRLDEVSWFGREEIRGKRFFVVALRCGKRFEHENWLGSADKIESRLLEALRAAERGPPPPQKGA